MKVCEILGATAVALVAPVDTSLALHYDRLEEGQKCAGKLKKMQIVFVNLFTHTYPKLYVKKQNRVALKSQKFLFCPL